MHRLLAERAKLATSPPMAQSIIDGLAILDRGLATLPLAAARAADAEGVGSAFLLGAHAPRHGLAEAVENSKEESSRLVGRLRAYAQLLHKVSR